MPPPEDFDGTVELGENEMAANDGCCETGNLNVAMTLMANGAAEASRRRTDRADQLSGDSQAMWTIAMTSPTIMAGLGFRTATESGSGRTRAETNEPYETGASRPRE